MTLSTLITKLERSDSGSRELDAEIWLATTEGATRRTTTVKSATNLWAPYDIDETRDATGRLIIVPSYTESLDAAVALVNRLLPGWRICTEHGDTYSSSKFVRGWGMKTINGDSIVERPDDEIALCICTSLLRALSKDTDHETL